jgi:hypothetical protein
VSGRRRRSAATQHTELASERFLRRAARDEIRPTIFCCFVWSMGADSAQSREGHIVLWREGWELGRQGGSHKPALTWMIE